MSAFLNVIRRSASGAKRPANAKGLARLKGWSSNLPIVRNYYDTHPFINLMRVGDYWDNAAFKAVNHWLRDLTAGSTASQIMWRANHKFLPAGDYVVCTLSGAHCTITDQGGTQNHGLTNVSQGAASPTQSVRECLFTVPDLGANNFAAITLRISITNGTGATIANISDIYVGKVANRADWYVGQATGDLTKEFNPEFVESLRGTGAIRFNDWLGMNGGGDHSFATPIATPANCQWAYDDVVAQMPPAVCAALAKLLGCGIWFSPKCNNEGRFYQTNSAQNCFISLLYVDSAADLAGLSGGTYTQYSGGMRLRPHLLAEDDPMVFQSYNHVAPVGFAPENTKYFVHVLDANRYQLKTAPGAGTPIAVTDNLNPTAGTSSTAGDYQYSINKLVDPTAYFNAFVDEIWNVYPDAPMILGETENESWNDAYQHGYFDTVVPALSGDPYILALTNQNVRGACGLAWMQLKLWKAIERRYPREVNVRMLIGANGWFNRMAGAFDYPDPGIVSPVGTLFKNQVDAYSIATYKGLQGPFDVLAAANVDTLTDTEMSAMNDIAFTDLAASLDEARIALATAAPNVQLITYEVGWANYFIRPYQSAAEQAVPPAKIAAMGMRMHNFLRSDAGGAFGYKYMKTHKLHGALNVQIWHSGNWSETGDSFSAYGIREFGNTPDSPYMKAVRAFNWY